MSPDIRLWEVESFVSEMQLSNRNIFLNPEEHNLKRSFQKTATSYSTEVDPHIENLFKTKLKEAFPGVGFIGEETDSDSESDSAGEIERYSFLVDPVDGTSVYITNGEYYSNVVALLDREKGKIPFISVYQPARGRQYIKLEDEVLVREEITTSRGGWQLIDRRPQLSKSASEVELKGVVYEVFRHYPGVVPAEMEAEIKGKITQLFVPTACEQVNGRKYKFSDVRAGSGSSGLDGCNIADGNLHFYRSFLQKPWDMLGMAYAQAAGCIVECGETPRDIRGGDLESCIARSTKKSLLNVAAYANPSVKEIVDRRVKF